jgi:hypothetical protein
MKTRFQSQQQVAHVWAQQNHESGRCNGALYFEGPTIYSYGSHFPCATFIDDETVLVNSDSYSVSTSKQQGYVRSAINHKKRIYASTAVIKAFLWDRSFNAQAQNAALTELTRAVENSIFRAKQKKAAKYKANDINAARSSIATCKGLFDSFGIAYPEALLKLEAMTQGDDFAAIVQADDERRAALAKIEKEKREKIEAEVIADIKTNWINGLPLQSEYSLYSCSKIFMRIEGDEIITTRGARFPVAHAVKAFKFIRAVKENEVPQAWTKNGKTIHLGHFEIDMIASDGTVKAGCHTVEYDEILRLATILKIYP